MFGKENKMKKEELMKSFKESLEYTLFAIKHNLISVREAKIKIRSLESRFENMLYELMWFGLISSRDYVYLSNEVRNYVNDNIDIINQLDQA